MDPNAIWIPVITEKQRETFNPDSSRPHFQQPQRRESYIAAALSALVDAGVLTMPNVRMCGKTSIVSYRYTEHYRKMLYDSFDPCI